MKRKLRRRSSGSTFVLVLVALALGACGNATALTQSQVSPSALRLSGAVGTRETLVSEVPASAQHVGTPHLSCGSARFCVAVDATGYAYRTVQGSWKPWVEVDPNATVTGISCPASNRCYVVDNVGNVITWNGERWSSLANLDPTGGGFSAISCPSDQMCVASDIDGRLLTYRSGAWNSDFIPFDTPAGAPLASSVDCVTTTMCLIVDSNANAIIYNGTSVGVFGGRSDQGNFPSSAACASAQYCVVADNGGSVYVYDGTTWTEPILIDPLGYALDSVACSAPSTCFVGDATGRIIALTPQGHSNPLLVDRGGLGVTGMVCITPANCSVFDGKWRVFHFAPRISS